MANKTKQKRNLDEVSPLELASVINPELAAAVQQAQSQQQDEVRPARSRQRQFTDNLVGNIRRQLNGEQIPTGWVTIPGAVALAGAVANPVSAALGMGAATGASKLVDAASKKVTGKDWTENVSKALDINPEVAAYTNPGLLAGGLPFTKGAKMLGNTVRGLYDAYRYGNAFLEPNTFGRNVINGLRRLSNRKGTQELYASQVNNTAKQTLAPSVTRQLGLNRRLALPYLQETLPEEYYRYHLAAQDDYWNNVSRRGVPYLRAGDLNNDVSIYNAIGANPEDINNAYFEGELNYDELADAINDYIDEGNDFSNLRIRPVDWEEELRVYEALQRDAMEQQHAGTDNPALDAPSSVEPFDWGTYDRPVNFRNIEEPQNINNRQDELDIIETPNNNIQISPFLQNVLNAQQQLNEEVFGVSIPEYIQSVRYPANSTRSLADTPPIVRENVEPSYTEPQSVSVSTTSEVSLDYLDFAKLTQQQKEDKLRTIIKKDIDEVSLSEEEETFLNYLRDNESNAFNNYSNILDEINAHKALVKQYKQYDDLIEKGQTSKIYFDWDKAPKIKRTNGRYTADYRRNGLHGDINSEGQVDIDGASFFNPAGSPNTLLNAVWQDLNKGDIISIADRGSLSRDSYPLYVMNLARILLDKNSKGFTLTRTKPLSLNGLAQAHYKGVALPTEFDPNYNKTSKTRVLRALNALGENYAKKYGVENPFKNVENEISFGSYGGEVPGFIIEKLKLGGCIPRRTLATGGSIHINPANRGKFNATKKRTGKTTEELTHSKNPLTRKRAIFAQNAAKWHH